MLRSHEPALEKIGLDRVSPGVEYYQSRFAKGIEVRFIYPFHLEEFDIQQWRKNMKIVVETLKETVDLITWGKEILKEAAGVFKNSPIVEYMGNRNSPRLYKTMAIPQEAKSAPDRRAIALCASHEVDGKVIASRAKEAEIPNENVAVFVFDEHDDTSTDPGQAGACRQMLLRDGLGAVTVLGMPKDEADVLRGKSEKFDYISMLEEIVRRKFTKETESMSRADLIGKLEVYYRWCIGEGAQDRELELFTSDPETARMLAQYYRQKRYEEIKGRYEILDDSANEQAIDERVRQLKEMGITHAVVSVDIDVFDLVKEKITVPVYSSWAGFMVFGLKPTKNIFNGLRKEERMSVIHQLLFGDMIKEHYKPQSQIYGHTIVNNLMSSGGITLEQFGRDFAAILKACSKYGITFGLQSKTAESCFMGTITELLPESIDFGGNTSRLVEGLCSAIHYLPYRTV